MARLEWDKTSERLYETGVKNCALYPWTKGAGEDKYVKLTSATAPEDWAVGTTNKYYADITIKAGTEDNTLEVIPVYKN